MSSLSIRDAYYKMLTRNGERPFTLKDLTFQGQIKMIWWKLRHQPLVRPIQRPRASWAQMFYAFGVTDTRNLRIAVAEADSIPEDIDVPIQRVRLNELG